LNFPPNNVEITNEWENHQLGEDEMTKRLKRRNYQDLAKEILN
jgi:hypothetical protein